MIVLGIESSAAVSSVCLTEDEKPLAIFSLYSTREHSVSLLPMIEETLEKCGKALCDVDLLCASDGPGSFTGIRIGISTVKGLAFSSDIPCVGVSSLESMAYLFSGVSGYVLPLLDARRGTVYSSLFRTDGEGNVKRLTDDAIFSISDLPGLLPEGRIFLTGDAVEAAKAVIPPDRISPSPALLKGPSAYGVALCGLHKYLGLSEKERDAAKGGDGISPLYLRKTLPERLREEKVTNEK